MGVAKDEEESSNSDNSHRSALAASRSFLARVFRMPSGAHPAEEGLEQEQQQQRERRLLPHFSLSNFLHRGEKQEEVLKYPVVGFLFCSETGKSDCAVLPTMSHPSCRIRTCRENEEPLYGWYSPACKLDLFAEDVCHKPFVFKTEATG